MALATLSIDLIAKLASLEAGMEKAVRIAEKDSARMAKAFGAVKLAAAGIGAVLGAALGGAGIAAFINETNDALLAIKDLAEGTGSTVENVSALENALRLNNRTLAEAQPILVKFNGALKEADGKNGISQALKAIGLSAEDLRRQDPVQALQQVGKALQGFNDDGNKARIVQELFGKSVAEVIPFLNDLAEAQLEATNGIREATEEADKFEKNMARLSKSAGDVGRALVGPVVSGLNQVLDLMKRFDQGGGLFKSFGDQFSAGIDGLRLNATVRNIEALQKTIAADGPKPYLIKALEDAKNQAKALSEQIIKSNEAIKGFAAVAGPELGRRPPNEGGGGLRSRNLPSILGSGGTKSAAAVAAENAKRLRDALKAGEEFGPGPFSSFEIPDALTAGLRALGQTDIGKLQDLQNTLLELMTLRGMNGDSPALAEAITEVSLAIDELNAKRLPAVLDPKSDFLRSEKGGYEATDKFMKDLEDQAAKTTDIAKDLGLTFSSAFEDAIVGGKGLREILSGIEQDILRIVTRKLVTEPLGNAITGLIGGGKEGGGIDFGGLLGKIAGGLGDLFGGFFADGGFLPPGRWGIAGERGPEPIYGGRTGMTVQPAGGGGRSITVNVSMPPGADRRTGAQFGAEVARALSRSSARNN